MSLYKTAYWTKRIFLGVLATVAFFLILRVFIEIGNLIFKAPTLPVVKTPNNQFGQLPAIQLDTIPLAQGSTPSFLLGGKPFETFPRIVEVHRTKQPTTTIDALDKANQIAKELQFQLPGQRITPTLYRYKSEEGVKILTIDIQTWEISLATNFTADKFAKENLPIIEQEAAVTSVIRFFQDLDLISEEFNKQNIRVYQMTLTPQGTLRRAQFLQEADFTKVVLYKEIEKNPPPSYPIDPKTGKEVIPKGASKLMPEMAKIVSENPSEPSVSIIFSGNNPNKKTYLFELKYTNWDTEDEIGRYEIKTPTEAWEEVKQGKGFLREMTIQSGQYKDDPTIKYPSQKVSKFLVFSAELNYLETIKRPLYIQPIYVFKGETLNEDGSKGNFVYYVQAAKLVSQDQK